jgi:hypothetical protein
MNYCHYCDKEISDIVDICEECDLKMCPVCETIPVDRLCECDFDVTHDGQFTLRR